MGRQQVSHRLTDREDTSRRRSGIQARQAGDRWRRDPSQYDRKKQVPEQTYRQARRVGRGRRKADRQVGRGMVSEDHMGQRLQAPLLRARGAAPSFS